MKNMSQPPFIPVNEPLLGHNEHKFFTECIKIGWVSSEGPFISQFEEKLADCLQRRHGIAVSSGTAALDVAIDSLC